YRDPTNPTVEEVAIRNRFLEIYPFQRDNIVSYQNDSACRCSREILQALGSDPVYLSEKMSYIFGDTTKVSIPHQIAGEIFEIDDTPEAWKEFTVKIETEMFLFRGMTM